MLTMKIPSSIVFIALLLIGCSTTPMTTSVGNKVLAPTEVLGQSALPLGATLKPAQSLIIGSGEQWIGRVVAGVGNDIDAAFKFFLDSYQPQGWTLIMSVRGKTNLMVFTKQERTATVELSEGGLIGFVTAVLTVVPRNAAVVAPKRP